MSEAENKNIKENAPVVLVSWQDFFGENTKQPEPEKNGSEESCEAIVDDEPLMLEPAKNVEEAISDQVVMINPSKDNISDSNQGRAAIKGGQQLVVKPYEVSREQLLRPFSTMLINEANVRIICNKPGGQRQSLDDS